MRMGTPLALAAVIAMELAGCSRQGQQMHKIYNPPTVHAPLAAYSHAVEVSPNARWLFLGGQVGWRPDGTHPEGFDEQAEQTWRNILNVLAAANMGAEDVVRVTTYVTNVSYRDAASAARKRALGSTRPAATFLVVEALAIPDMLIEVDVVAAKAP